MSYGVVADGDELRLVIVTPLTPAQREERGKACYNAAARGDVQRVRELVRLEGADPNWTNWRNTIGWTPCSSIAARCNHVDVVRCLVSELGADVNKTDRYGWTPCHGAARHNHVDVVRCLVSELAADANKRDDDGSTPCLVAVRHNHAHVVRCLVSELGADANQADNDGHTPRKVAEERGYNEMVAVIDDWMKRQPQ